MTTEEKCEWLLALLGSVKHGGMWAVPRATTCYGVDHINKRLLRTVGAGDEATEELLPLIGWSVEEVTK